MEASFLLVTCGKTNHLNSAMSEPEKYVRANGGERTRSEFIHDLLLVV